MDPLDGFHKSPDATYTAHPETPAPSLLCPVCNLPLVYRTTAVYGDGPLERRDYLECRTCGLFEYGHRTHTLRHMNVA